MPQASRWVRMVMALPWSDVNREIVERCAVVALSCARLAEPAGSTLARPNDDASDAQHGHDQAHERNEDAPRHAEQAPRMQRKLGLHEQVAGAARAGNVVPHRA